MSNPERKCQHGYGIRQGPCPTCDAPRCRDVARGFCTASIDGYCIGGTTDGRCYGPDGDLLGNRDLEGLLRFWADNEGRRAGEE